MSSTIVHNPNLSATGSGHYRPMTKPTRKLDGIFKLIDEMQAVNTKGVEPMSHGLDMVLRLREDAVTESNHRDQYQQNAPEAAEGYYLVPKVME